MCNLMHIGGPDKTLKHTCTIIVFVYCSIVNLIVIGLCLLYIPIYTYTSIYTYIHIMVYYLLGRSDNTDRTHLILLVVQDVLVFLARVTLAG